jgi:hypothetical protein
MEPKNKKEFRKLVNSAYQAGWTYSSFTNELWVEYANRWNHFVDYVEALKANTKLTEIKILIGEAPPFYRATKKPYEKAYFYSPDETGNSPWFSAPLAHFCPKEEFKYKHEKLLALASKGVLLLDIFPFPIIQDTEMRTDITGEFADHLSTYFFPLVKSVLLYLNYHPEGKSRILKIEWGITATKYAGTQLMLGENSRSCFEDNFPCFFNNPLTHPVTNKVYHKQFIRFYSSGITPPPNDDYLDIPNWTMSNVKEVESPYFIFVVTLLFANCWSQWRQERKDHKKRYSQKAFVKYLFSGKSSKGKITLAEINKLLAKRPILPIFSAGMKRISLIPSDFFNSKKI